eukprot:CAMPEP_0182941544 /NCGR_PEP_ID=MMETSP0105_2-20130417/49122_1 /TAXON_ID=81532 ORGANISM="Acanthoeca-like sp., Strain 10tr" /NCGR_SAMPLE_ID=MMETSP0105_2 /ASSEMBLY_ACC=CAM_ASM_000205 /LENGTH=256 /DNA_ID=CAMNT_0025081177 /DNA_START=70 /DNA_END=840 /DNA_ORIENTATION=+
MAFAAEFGVAGSFMLYFGLTYDKPLLSIVGLGAHLYPLLTTSRAKPSKPDGSVKAQAAAVAAPAPAVVPQAAPKQPEPVPKRAEPVAPKLETVIVAFDFDKCLMKGHWWAKYRNRPIEGINPQPADFALSNPEKVFTQMMKLPHVRVAVASFGRKDVITKAIQSILPSELANKVFITTPGDFPPAQDGNSIGDKNKQLDMVSQHFGVPLERVIFFDDDKNNIRAAREVNVTAHCTAPFNDSCVRYVSKHVSKDLEV